MMYLNGEIKAVYLGGHYHSEAYLGSVLVWGKVKEIPGEAHAQLAFENTADGVAVVLLPGDAAEALAMTANVTAETHGMADGSADETLIVDAQIMPQVHGVANRKATETLEIRPTINESILHTPNGIAINALLLQNSILGRNIIINKRKITELLELHTPILPAVGVVFNPIALGCELAMETTIPPGMAVVLNPIKFGTELMLTLPVPPAVAATFVDDKASLALQLVQTASAGDAALFADGQLDDGEVIAAAAEGAVANGAYGAAASGFTIGSMIQPGTLIMSGEQSDCQLTVETQMQPETLALSEALSSVGLKLECNAVGTAYLLWEYPEKHGDQLIVKQVYSATVKQNDAIENILEVT